jgi:hypothetical protein
MIIQLLPNGMNGSTVFTDLSSALFALGYIFSVDLLYLTIHTVVSIAGVAGNAFSVFIFYRPDFCSATSPPLFAYLRYEAMIGVVGNLAGAIYAFNICSDILPFTNTFISQWIQSYMAIPLINMGYYAKFLIELVVVVDRIVIIVPSFGS